MKYWNQQCAFFRYSLNVDCRVCPLSEVKAMKAKVLIIISFRDNISTGIVSMLKPLSSRNWGISFIIHIWQKITHQWSIFWDVNPITKYLPDTSILVKCFGINTFEHRLDSYRFWYDILFTEETEMGPHHDIEGASD